MNANFSALAGAIASFAPTLATMLGGPLAGSAVSALEGAFGLSPGAGAGEITKVVQSGSMTPEIVAAVRAADQKHAEIMGQQGIDLNRANKDFSANMVNADVTDRSSARLRESNVKDNTPKVLAYVIVAGFLSMVFATLMGYAKVESVLAGTLIGYLSAKCEQVVAYYFGSSSGAARGQELLAQSTPAPSHAQPIEVTSK